MIMVLGLKAQFQLEVLNIKLRVGELTRQVTIVMVKGEDGLNGKR